MSDVPEDSEASAEVPAGPPQPASLRITSAARLLSVFRTAKLKQAFRAFLVDSVVVAFVPAAIGLLLFCHFHLSSVEEVRQSQKFLETVNGATWPEHWEIYKRSHSKCFAGALAYRTALNTVTPIVLLYTALRLFFFAASRRMFTDKELTRIVVEMVAARVRERMKLTQEQQADISEITKEVMLDCLDDGVFQRPESDRKPEGLMAH